MSNIFFTILLFLLILCLMISFHELGHLIFAKLFHVKVLRFSIGFGKKFVFWQDHNGTEYCFSIFPLGGYIKLLDERETEIKPYEKKYTFNHQTCLRKITILLAGPIFNVVLAILVYWLTFIIGFPSYAPMIGKITTYSIAEKADLKPYQIIKKIDHHSTPDWTAVQWALFTRIGDKGKLRITATLPNQTSIQNYSLDLTSWKIDQLNPDPLTALGIIPFFPSIFPIIETASTKSGLKSGDYILAIQQQLTPHWKTVVKIIRSHPNQILIFKVKRDKKIIILTIKTSSRYVFPFKKIGTLNITPKIQWPPELVHQNKYNIQYAFIHALHEVKNYAFLNLVLIGKLLTGKLSLQTLAGPITLFSSTEKALRIGFAATLYLIGFLSLTIGIINLLPIPGLDGSQIIYALIEKIIKKPISIPIQLLAYKLGLIVIILLIFQAFVNDFLRLFIN